MFALDRLDAAKAAEVRDVSTFQVLDPGALLTRKSRSKMLESTVPGAVLAFAGSPGYAWWKARRVTGPKQSLAG